MGSFQIGMDTPIQLAAELVNAGHINPKTANATSKSIQYIIDHYPVCKVTTFKLSEIGKLSPYCFVLSIQIASCRILLTCLDSNLYFLLARLKVQHKMRCKKRTIIAICLNCYLSFVFSGLSESEYDEAKLIGYAQLSAT
jgi:hypothetical protein